MLDNGIASRIGSLHGHHLYVELFASNIWHSSVTLHYQQCLMTICHVQPCTTDLGKGHGEICQELPVSIKTSSICAGVPSLLSFCFSSNVTVNCVKTWCCMLPQGHMLNGILHSRSNVGSKDSTTSSSAFYAHQMQRDKFGSISDNSLILKDFSTSPLGSKTKTMPCD